MCDGLIGECRGEHKRYEASLPHVAALYKAGGQQELDTGRIADVHILYQAWHAHNVYRACVAAVGEELLPANSAVAEIFLVCDLLLTPHTCDCIILCDCLNRQLSPA